MLDREYPPELISLAWQDPSVEPSGRPVRSPSEGLIGPRLPAARGRSVAEILVDLGVVSLDQAAEAMGVAREAGMESPVDALVQRGLVTADNIAHATAERHGLPFVRLDVFTVNMAAANLLSFETARRYRAVPIEFTDESSLLVAMADPGNVVAADDLAIVTGCSIEPAVAAPEDIDALIGQLNKLGASVEEAMTEEDELSGAEITEIRESATDSPIVKLANAVIAQAVESGASDVHFDPGEAEMAVRFRVDGVLFDSTMIPRRMVPGVVSRIKVMADLDIAERRVPQDGRVSLKVDGRMIDIRVVTMPSTNGESVVLRLLDKEKAVVSLDSLGLRGEQLAAVEEATSKPYGATFVTGPTGSGKSTTLYAALLRLNRTTSSVFTIEDPVEYQIPGAVQVQVAPKAGLTFASGLRSMLRADPDTIMVGEIRDNETAHIAVEAAMTGHLVLTTLHTNDSPSAVARLIEMGIEPFLIASALDCVVAQRLARVLCDRCKRPRHTSAEGLRTAGFEVDEGIDGYAAGGCSRCGGTGYKGRIGIFEVMQVNDAIRTLTLKRAPASQIRAQARRDGMLGLREDGLEKVRAGITSIEEVTRVVT